LSAWAYRECLKEHYETRILVEAQRINMEFAEELPLSHIVSIVRSIEKFTNLHFSEEEFSKIQKARGKKSGAARAEKAKPKNQMLLDMDAAGLTLAEIAEQIGKSKDATRQALKRAKQKAAENA
jgi:hypothetical protein